MKIKNISLIVLVLICMGTPAVVFAEQNKTITITDLIGRTVDIPETVHHVAALSGPGPEKVFLLGGIDKLAIVPPFYKGNSWATKIIPGIKNIPSDSIDDPSIEGLLNQSIDVVLFCDYPKPIEKMADAGIPVVVTLATTPETEPQSIDEFKDNFKKDISIYGDVLGPDAKAKAEKFNKYFDEKVNPILNITSSIPESEKPKVYYVRGPDALTTHGQNTNTAWLVSMAGGHLVSDQLQDMMPKVSIEQVISWNPDIIVMGRVNSTSLIMDDPKWKDIKAVKEGKVYTNPDGVMSWDYSSEGVLLLEYLAKLFYPDKFSTIDMTKEIKEFYSKFYNYSLTDDEADRILNHLSPA
jgi:iron complex transport system substrate-binding protein